MEWAGAFGDLGTLLPFVVAYLATLKMDPFGILFSFGLAMVVCGLYYKTPFPVQPMKAIGAVAATQALTGPMAFPCAAPRGGGSSPPNTRRNRIRPLSHHSKPLTCRRVHGGSLWRNTNESVRDIHLLMK